MSRVMVDVFNDHLDDEPAVSELHEKQNKNVQTIQIQYFDAHICYLYHRDHYLINSGYSMDFLMIVKK